MFHPSPPDQESEIDEIYAALWHFVLQLARGAAVDPIPAELEELAALYFRLHPPAAKA